jgi:hypothetical protein
LPDSYVRPDDDYDSGSDDDDDDGETQEEREKKAFERVVKNTEPSSSILGKFGVTGGIVHELCGDLYNIALIAGVVSKLNNPVSLITFLAKEGKPLVEAELKVAGIIISGTKQERNELLNSIKNALGEEFVQPFIDVARDFNKMVSGQKLSGKEQFELGRDLYQCTMTAIMAYSAIRAAGKLGAKLARSMSKLTKEGGALSKLSAVVRDQRGGGYLGKASKGAAKTENSLANIKYTDKVKAQAAKGDYHGFPESVDGFGANGKVTQITGGDKVVRTKVEIPGSYNGKTGVFQYIIEPDGVTCNHRLFVPNK